MELLQPCDRTFCSLMSNRRSIVTSSFSSGCYFPSNSAPAMKKAISPPFRQLFICIFGFDRRPPALLLFQATMILCSGASRSL